jgi:hypothetical protein
MWKNEGNRKSQGSHPQYNFVLNRKQLKIVKYFNSSGSIIKIMQDEHIKLNPGLSRQKQLSTERRLFFTRKLKLN